MRDPNTAGDDVFCLVKSQMCSSGLSQDPLLVWPAALEPQSRRFLGAANNTRLAQVRQFEAERQEEIRKLASAFRRDFPQMRRAIQWYEQLLNRDPAHQEAYPQLTFLKNVADAGPSIRDFQLGARPHPLRPHNLEVAFHREQF